MASCLLLVLLVGCGWVVCDPERREEVLNALLLMRGVLVAPLLICHPHQVVSDQPLVTAVTGGSLVMQLHPCSLKRQVMGALRGL